jgi:hypothetical protein
MNINLSPFETIKLLKNPESWSKFLSYYYYINDNLELRTIHGSEKVFFDSTLIENVLKVLITTQEKKLEYTFTVNPVIDDYSKTDLELTTNYHLSYIQNKSLQLMGINIALDKNSILDKLSHFVDFGHIH